ncbi:hypothetical protein COLO4_16253 [Corchorus olitorius]|uniref:FBD domain-containing protein n=1 Tax=Corchorus olitorius TaxID=93759 RepID=A0A1R3JIF5_9ROSI|nr:hypothetical protein COLO4_16253 [Corchorus olitorius]
MILVLGPELGRLAFDNLVELKITEELIHHDWRGTWLVEFLQCSPNLQTFDLSLHFDEDYEFDGGWSPPEKELSCLLFRLKKLVLNYNGRWVFEMIKYFLKNARGLEELKVVDHDEWDKELGMNKELLFLPRRSKGCQVLID